MPWTSLCDFDELIEGQGKCVEIEGFRLAVFLNGKEIHVVDNTCPHAGHELAGGPIENGCVTCPYHGWVFRLADGEMPGSPGIAISVYPARLLIREAKPTLVQANLPIF
jgi:nitrite reductase/ring-hydroxylating ferredoxin subunit